MSSDEARSGRRPAPSPARAAHLPGARQEPLSSNHRLFIEVAIAVTVVVAGAAFALLGPGAGGGGGPAQPPGPAGEARVIDAQVEAVAASMSGVRVVGNRLVNSAGRTVQLHGVNSSGSEFACNEGGAEGTGFAVLAGPLDEPSTYVAMQKWNINAVRVPLNEQCWLGINNVKPDFSGPVYREAIKTVVQQIQAAGMVAIVDLHRNSPGTFSTSNRGQEVMPDADHSPAFWTSVAETFKNQRNVFFDLFNEPHPSDTQADRQSDRWGWKCWLEGCNHSRLADGTVVAWKSVGMQKLIDVVRATGATNPVIVNGNGWSADLNGFLASGVHDPAGQMIAGIHTYDFSGPKFPDMWTSDNGGPVKEVAAVYPVIVGEIGYSNSTGPVRYLDKALPFLDSVGVSYLVWTWNPWQDNFGLISDWSGTPEAGQGRFYQSHLLTLPPSDLG